MIKLVQEVTKMSSVYIVIDTETTGSNPLKGDRIIEIAAFPIYKNKIYYDLMFHTLVNPEIKIPAQISGIHGLKDRDVSDKPTMFEIYPRLRNYLGDSTVVGHSIFSDLKFFDISAKETGEFPINNRFIDTLELSQLIFKKGPYNLYTISKRLKIKDKPTHRALDDARVTAKVFLALKNKIGGSKAIKQYEYQWRG
jgi:DNA polymerase-3 subunit epsilon